MDKLLSTTEVARELDRPSRFTIHRWMRKGVLTAHGRVQLRHQRLGGRLYTTHEWLLSFFKQLEEASKGQRMQEEESDTSPSYSHLLSRRRKAISDAEQSAADRGL